MIGKFKKVIKVYRDSNDQDGLMIKLDDKSEHLISRTMWETVDAHQDINDEHHFLSTFGEIIFTKEQKEEVDELNK